MNLTPQRPVVLLGDIHSDFASVETRPPKVLVVDDTEENLYAMQKTLSKLNCTVLTATKGADALALTLRHEFAVILLDVQMPVMNGFETARYLRDNAETRSIPIIFVTAINKEQRHVAQGYGSGAVDYLFKPVDPAMLLSKVNIFIEIDKSRRDLKHMLSVVTEVSHRYQVLLESASEGVLGVDDEGVVTFANPAASLLLGRSASLSGCELMSLLAPDDPNAGVQWSQSRFMEGVVNQERIRTVEGWLTGPGGRNFPAEYSFAPFSPAYGLAGGVLIFQDITMRRQAASALLHLSRHDEMTDLPNRAYFSGMVDLLVAKAARQKRGFSVLFLDLDGFKSVNDSFGHAAGDQVLRDFASRLRSSVRGGDMVARVGGDEFAVLVDDAPDDEGVDQIAAKVVEVCREPFRVGEKAMRTLTVSIGITTYPEGGADATTLLASADSAMYRAKAEGKNQFSR